VDRRVLRLIKLWLKAPIEERGRRGPKSAPTFSVERDAGGY